jgi:hypothetical protein
MSADAHMRIGEQKLAIARAREVLTTAEDALAIADDAGLRERAEQARLALKYMVAGQVPPVR